ncbi:beta and beta-prime subunits of DNA dependent RNA-polymerase [Gigaspora margarita]|uniref:DNA-directed RNA polymerase subunit n=2 Tax=Gigaspora margarita TaxID=4874 RepID=A0A8H3XHI0_GIGMA|nr:beta and beta-prime subunits of DNA dependent RNA-polymerase [Gigaspora margarita]
MNIAHPLGVEINSATFSCYSSNEIKKLSVKEIVNPVIFDSLGLPTEGGLYDPALGPVTRNAVCGTCNLDHFNCPGHFGHIQLPCPVYNPVFFSHALTLLKAICLNCHRFRLAATENFRYTAKLKLLNYGLLLEAQRIDGIAIEDILTTDEDRKSNDVVSIEFDPDIYFRSLEQYVNKCLKNGDRKIYKTTAINAERKNVISEFLKRSSTPKQCGNCKLYCRSFKKEGHSKIFQCALSSKLSKAQRSQELANQYARQQNIQDTKDQDSLVEEDQSSVNQNSKVTKEYVTPEALREHFRKFFVNESDLCSLLYGKRGLLLDKPDSLDEVVSADIFFMNVIAVPPTRFRPASAFGNNQTSINPQNEHLTRILNARLEFCTHAAMLDKNKLNLENNERSYVDVVDNLMKSWVELQNAVNGMFDNTKGNLKSLRNKEPAAGVKQILEKKEGLFRKHLMGKRVNYAARSVISPDPNIDTDEIGVPIKFAKRLTYPEPVTSYNVKTLSQAVSNGPDIWPGATFVQNENGSLINLASLSLESRISLGQQLLREQQDKSSFTQYFVKTPYINKKIYRHIQDGDMLLINRQPTLHKPSIMAHRARVLKGEITIRMHYANCKAYNADFDGDEMNMHFPQNEIARAEASLIGNTSRQYLGPTSGSPLRGLIQDHVVAGVWMTCKDTFFTKADYQQIVFSALRLDSSDSRRILTVPPAIQKPKALWTGKQMITTILKNLTIGLVPLNLRSKTKISSKYWGWSAPEEETVIFIDGDFLTGILDKSQIGDSAFGLVHSCYELYSANITGQFLSVMGRLFTTYMQRYGFSCRMDDLRLIPEGDQERKKLMNRNADIGKIAAFEYIGLDKIVENVDLPSMDKEFRNMMEEVLRDSEKHQGLDAKMKSRVNKLTSSIIANCIPTQLLKRFPHNNMQTMTISGAKGSSVNVSQISCCLGQQELEGRRVPVMVSGKTLPSFLPYEPSARAGGFIGGRFLTGIKPQEFFFHCMAGREGLIDTAVKTSRSGYLQRCLIKHLEGLKVHYDHTVRDGDGSVIQFHYGEDSLDITKQKHLYEFKFNTENHKALLQKYDVAKAQQVLNTSCASIYSKKAAKKPHEYDPVLSKYSPSTYLGCVSEKFHKTLEKYTNEDLDGLFKANSISKPAFRKLMHLKYLHSLVEPGEAVGLLAAQGIGEPSTQMTLNTFHFAGFGAKNVTLGIPRLREIIMTASEKIKTPMMTLPLLENVPEQESLKFCQEISKLTLAEIIDQMVVTERLSSKRDTGGSVRCRIYNIRMQFYRREEYTEEYNIVPLQIERAIESKFIKHLVNAISSELKSTKSKNEVYTDITQGIDKFTNKTRKDATFDEDDPINAGGDESDDGDGDATNARINSRTKQFASYDGPDDDDLEIIKENDLAFDNENSETDDNNERREDTDNDTDQSQDSFSKSRDKTKRSALRDKIVASSNCITDYQFDHVNSQWCDIELRFPADSKKLLLLSLAEDACKKTVIHEVSGINKCYPIANDTEGDTSKTIATEGVNFHNIWLYDNIIDINKIYSNDIAAILKTYGVEAARGAIMKEISDVFAAYSINVDPRHLTLVADYMTFEGTFKPFNRMGLASNSSPFLQMSFETTCSFLTNAVLNNDTDTLNSPSARLVLGKVVQGGTGIFEVRQLCKTY